MKRRIYILILFTIQLSIFRNNYGQHAIEFLQEGSHISIQESAELHLATFTLEGWIMISDTGTALITGEDSLFVIPIISRGFEDPEGESGLNYFLGLRRQDFILVADYEDTNHKNHKLSGFTSLLMNHWYHIAVTYDGSLFKLYLNGKLETMTEIPEQPLNEAIGNLGIGKMFDKNNNLHGSFVGRMDAIRIWNYARSQREILSNINSEIVTNESGLLVSLNLNEGSGTLFHSTGSLDAAMIKGASLNWTAGALFQALIPPENLEMPVLKIGLISDPQYCDYDNSTTRFYRQTLSKLVAAVDTLNNENLDFVITLGDIIDRDFVSFDSIMPLYGSLVAPTYFLLGNHDLEYVADSVKQFVREKLNMRDYYSFELGSWRFLVLDGTELAEYTVILHPELAEEGDSLRQSIAGQINDVESNGGVSKAQQLWVKQQIEEAYSKNQLVIVFCHFPVYPEPHRKNLWNNREIIDLLGKYSHVAAYINGHNHEGNYGFTDGIHYLTHSAMVETDSINSFSIVNIYPGKIVQYGYGLNHDRLLSFDNPFKMMPLPELSQNIIHYNTGVDDFIGKFNAQAISGNSCYNYSFIDNHLFNDNELFKLEGDSLLLRQLPEINSKTDYRIKIGFIDSSFDTASRCFTIVLDTLSFIQRISLEDLTIPSDTIIYIELDSIYIDYSRFGLIHEAIVIEETIVTCDIENGKIVIYPQTTGVSDIIIRTSDPFTGYSVTDTFKITICSPTYFSENYKPGLFSQSLQVYPNPSQDKINIRFSVPETGMIDCILYSQKGEILEKRSFKCYSKGSIQQTFETGELSPGTYIIETKCNGRRMSSGQFVKR